MGRPVVHFQILATDPARAERFYSQLFEWKVDAADLFGYRAIDTGSPRGIRGGIWPSPPEGHAFVQLFIEVEGVAAHVARAVARGAKVVVPPTKLPRGEELAILHDVEGIPFGLMQPAPK